MPSVSRKNKKNGPTTGKTPSAASNGIGINKEISAEDELALEKRMALVDTKRKRARRKRDLRTALTRREA